MKTIAKFGDFVEIISSENGEYIVKNYYAYSKHSCDRKSATLGEAERKAAKLQVIVDAEFVANRR